jgi:hypothetical protein
VKVSLARRGGRSEAGGQCGKQSREDRERDDASIQLDAPPNRNVGRDVDGRHGASRRVGHRDRADSPEQGKQRTLDEHLSHEAPLAGADRGANGEIAPA